jgi:hypothetical protein
MDAWLAENITLTIGGVAISGLIAFMYRRFMVKHLPTIMISIKTFLATVISNLLGMSFGEDLVESIPLIKKLEEGVSQAQVANEQLLIEYKRKILNPLYDKAETEIYIRMFDALMIKLDKILTQETLDILQAFEDLYKEGE